MNKVRVFLPLFLATGVLGVIGSLGSSRVASAHPALKDGDNLVAAAIAFVDAVNRGDADKVRGLTDPAFQEISSTGETSDLEAFLKYTAELGVHITIVKCQQTGPDSVSCDIVASGGPLPVLPHPWTETGVFTFSKGKIIRLVGTLSAQTAQDLGAFAQPAERSGDLIASTLAFADAYNAGDGEKMRQMADPAFQQVSGTGEPLDLEGFIGTISTGVDVALSNCQLIDLNRVSCDTILSGGPIPPLAHPWSETSVLTFSNARIRRLDETLSAQTAEDLQAYLAANPQPGMPTTGVAALSTQLLTLLLGMLLVASGSFVRKVNTDRR